MLMDDAGKYQLMVMKKDMRLDASRNARMQVKLQAVGVGFPRPKKIL